jgi:hypothetical protein
MTILIGCLARHTRCGAGSQCFHRRAKLTAAIVDYRERLHGSLPTVSQGLYELSPRFSLASRGRITVLTVVIPHRCTHIVVDPPCAAGGFVWLPTPVSKPSPEFVCSLR